MDRTILQGLAADDPYRRVLDHSFESLTIDPVCFDAVRPTLVELVMADMEHRPCTGSMRSARLGRFLPYLAWCHRQGYPLSGSTVMDADLIETYIAQCPDAASTTDAVYQLRSALGPLCSHFGNPQPPAQKVRRDATRSQPPVPLLAARRLLRVADSLRSAQARSDARVVLSLAHGAGLESRYMSQVCGTDVRPTPDGRGAAVTHADNSVDVHDAYAATLLGVAASTPGPLLGTRTRSVAETVRRLNEALRTSGYSLQVDVPALRAGWLEWGSAVGTESLEGRDEEG